MACGGGSGYVLLWSNNNPLKEFAAQTVVCDISKYRFLMVITKALAHESDDGLFLEEEDCPYETHIVLNGAPTAIQFLSPYCAGKAKADNYIRKVTISDDGLVFGDVEYCLIEFPESKYPNYRLIPLYIYGIR